MYMYMVDESQNVPEQKPSFLDEVKAEREALEKVRDENKVILEEMKKIRAEEILSGKAPQPKEEVKPEENPVDYLKRALENKL